MNNTPKDKKVLSMEEGAALLGAEQPETINNIRMDPIGMMVLATQIAKRLVSQGGRPTDASWNISRKIPMKETTWKDLEELAEISRQQDKRVATGQIAAIALEMGLEGLKRKEKKENVFGELGTRYTGYKFHEESDEEAVNLCGTIREERFW